MLVLISQVWTKWTKWQRKRQRNADVNLFHLVAHLVFHCPSSPLSFKASSTLSRVFSKSEIFSSVFKKNLRPQVAFLNRIWLSTRSEPEPMHDVIVFENLRFCPSASTRIRWICIFKILHPGERIWKPPFSIVENAGFVWTVAVLGEKSLRFRK